MSKKVITGITTRDGGGIPHGFTPIRDEVADFALVMERKLAKKDGEGKTHWHNLPPAALLEFLEIEIRELKAAMNYLSLEEQMGEAVDVGNYAMILWDRLRAEKEAGDGQDSHD
jgi:hypothetical protein